MPKSALNFGVKLLFPPSFTLSCLPTQIFARGVSLNSAITRGIRKSQKAGSRPEEGRTSFKRPPNESYSGEKNGSKGNSLGVSELSNYSVVKSRTPESRSNSERTTSPPSDRFDSSPRDTARERYSPASGTPSSTSFTRRTSPVTSERKSNRWEGRGRQVKEVTSPTNEYKPRGLRNLGGPDEYKPRGFRNLGEPDEYKPRGSRSTRELDEKRYTAREDIEEFSSIRSRLQRQSSSSTQEFDDGHSKPWQDRRSPVARDIKGRSKPFHERETLTPRSDDYGRSRPTLERGSSTRKEDDAPSKPRQERRTSRTRDGEEDRPKPWQETRSLLARDDDEGHPKPWKELRVSSETGHNEDGRSRFRQERRFQSPRDSDDSPFKPVQEHRTSRSRDIEDDNAKRSSPVESSLRPSRDPISIPYTTSASEFIYGTSSVIAAMQARRRQFYKLYVHSGANREVLDRDFSIRRLAKSLSIPIRDLSDTNGLRLLDKMSTSRPHNGYVLEASPIPKLPITALPTYELEKGGFHVPAAPQSREDSEINGTSTLVPFAVEPKPYPLILLLDGIQDPGNLGAIIRTAYYLGVSAVTYVPKNSSAVTPVAVKASAGAAEFLPLFSTTGSTAEFVVHSRRAGWKVYAATAPDADTVPTRRFGKHKNKQAMLGLSALPPLLQQSPCVLVLGGEGFGIPAKVLEHVDGKIVIRGAKRPRLDGLDSLNVSVATGLLCSAFLRPGESNVGRIAKGSADLEENEDADESVEENDEKGEEKKRTNDGKGEGGDVDWSRLF